MTSHITLDELSLALDATVDDLLSDAGIDAPPVDADIVAASLGIIVATDAAQAERARYVRLREYRRSSSRPSILLRPEPRPERRQWAVAHEVGEQAVWQVFSRMDIDPREASPGARESVANQLANRLLLPGAWFELDGAACDWDLFALKLRYATASHELIARRMLDCEPPVVVTLFDQGVVSFRRANCAARVPPPSDAERACRQIAHETGRQQISHGGDDRIQAWPIHEPEWRREILRFQPGGAGDDWAERDDGS